MRYICNGYVFFIYFLNISFNALVERGEIRALYSIIILWYIFVFNNIMWLCL